MEIKRGDIVGRKSYGKDILFYVDRIIKAKNGNVYCILKGVQFRIEADAPLEDLEKVDKEKVSDEKRNIESKLKKRIASTKEFIYRKKNTRNQISNALILHLDGDKKYTQKSQRYYNKMGIRAIVKNVPEYKQPQVIRSIS